MEELDVKNIIIGKQFEDSENLQKFLQIVKEKNLTVNVVEAEARINIENNVYFDVLWPDSLNVMNENSINNNSLVCKFNYKSFSVLFTGDIEEEAENVLISKYKNTNILESTILKIAHHGSKSSTIQGFLDLVNPKIALIGVGSNNKFGHPDDTVLEKLNKVRSKGL